MTLLTALIFGLAPALSVTRVTPNEALKEQSRSVSGDRRFGLRNALVVLQVALSLALVVAAGLFVRTFSSLAAVPLGINPHPLLVVELNVQHSDVPPGQRAQLFERLREASESVPGVKTAAVSLIRPLSGQGWNGVLQLPGSALSNRQRQAWLNGVSPGWFATLGMRIVAGRDLQSADGPGSPRVAVVNQTFANRFFSGNAVLEHDITVGGIRPTVYHVVGVVTDAVYRSPREGVTPTVYVPVAQADRLWPDVTLTVETWPGARGSIERSLVETLSRVDARTAFTLHWYEDLVRVPMAQERLVAILSGFFGGLALLLAGLGLYGLTSYSVNRRRREIGVRMALGANPGGVVRMVLRRVGWLVAAGTTAGAGLSWWASRYVATSLLFHLEPRDPATFAFAALVLVGVGALAGWLPARRASRIDPTRVLREE